MQIDFGSTYIYIDRHQIKIKYFCARLCYSVSIFTKAYYAFNAHFCNPSSGNEKGLVENLVGFIRRNAMVPLPKVASLEELNDRLIMTCKSYQSHRIQG